MMPKIEFYGFSTDGVAVVINGKVHRKFNDQAWFDALRDSGALKTAPAWMNLS